MTLALTPDPEDIKAVDSSQAPDSLAAAIHAACDAHLLLQPHGFGLDLVDLRGCLNVQDM